MNKWLILLISLVISLVMAGSAYAQSATDSTQEAARKYGVSFPVADLGACGSFSDCRNFCEDPVNGEACINYGKLKGFYKDDTLVTDQGRVLEEARRRIGCDSYEACLNFCEVQANFGTCNSFARSQGIV
ncbi:MAG: hypothetical protein Q8Q91_02545, partial [Candidatus Daviesbacteria bacterium]|nr:hypothetical protein [Candidatus Daviesbacteria bacterium]